VIKILQHTHKH